MTLSAQWIRHSWGLAHNGGQLINSVKYSVKCWSLNKENREGKKKRKRKEVCAHEGKPPLFLFIFLLLLLSITGQVCIIIFFQLYFLPCWDSVPGISKIFRLIFFLPCLLLFFYSSSPPPYLSCHIASFVVTLVSSPNNGYENYILVGTFHVAKAPAGVIFFAEVKTSSCICCTSCM